MNPASKAAVSQGQWPSMPAATRDVLLEVLVHGGLPRSEIANRLGLSKASLTRITRSLVDGGLLVEGATELRSSLGRPSELLHVAAAARHFVGIKLTGDHLYAAVTDLRAQVVASHDEPLVSQSVEDTVDQIARVVAELRLGFPTLTAVGVCLAGANHRVNGEQFVIESLYLGWKRVPLAQLVATATGLPTATENDVLALTAAEHWFGAGAGLSSLALVTIGVGIGCGLIVNGELLEGTHGRAGHIGHLTVNQAGPVCDRGHRGCAEAYLTNGAIAGALGPGPDGVHSYDSALARARSGEPAALRVFEDAGYALGAIIGVVSNLIDPQKVILTGDGLPLYEVASASVEAGMRATLETDFADVDLDVQPFTFGEWARAGAVLAIRTVTALP